MNYINIMKKVNVEIMSKTRKYLFWCVNEHIDFRIPELKSVASLFKIPLKWVEKPKEDPFLILELASEQEARMLVSRCMLVRGCYELWGEGSTLEELLASVRATPSHIFVPHLSRDKSFRVRVEGFNKTLQISHKLRTIESLNFLPFEGPVDLKNATTKLNLFEYYGLNHLKVPELPYRLFLGRWIGDGQRALISGYSLKQRRYIGSTSMDAQLAFIMTNMAQVSHCDLVLDPFVGTGSILVSSAHHGAYILGSDIDFLTLHARTKPTRVRQVSRSADESIRENLRQYGLEHRFLDVAVVDCANTAWRHQPTLDAIITDPPYGIREATSRVGSGESSDAAQSVQDKKKKRRQRQQHERTEVATSRASDELGDDSAGADLLQTRGTNSKNLLKTDNNLLKIGGGDSAKLLNTGEINDESSKPGSDYDNKTLHSDKRLETVKNTFYTSEGVAEMRTQDPGAEVRNSDATQQGEGSEILYSSGKLSQEDSEVRSTLGDIISQVHYPSKVTYSLSEVFKDLLNFAASNLVVGGKLVFWLPVFRDDYSESSVPRHPCLQLCYNSEQVLTAYASRRLITFVKTRPPTKEECSTSDVTDLTSKFREKSLIASQMSREERMARKCLYPRDKRGQGLAFRLDDSVKFSDELNGWTDSDMSDDMNDDQETAPHEKTKEIKQFHLGSKCEETQESKECQSLRSKSQETQVFRSKS